MSKQVRMKKYAVQFMNNLLNETTEVIVDAFNKDEAVDVANLYIDAYKLSWEDDISEFYKVQSVAVMKG